MIILVFDHVLISHFFHNFIMSFTPCYSAMRNLKLPQEIIMSYQFKTIRDVFRDILPRLINPPKNRIQNTDADYYLHLFRLNFGQGTDADYYLRLFFRQGFFDGEPS
jgi:hypothetical protein